MIINRGLVVRAIELVRPAAEAILACDDMVWGPRWVIGVVDAPRLITVMFQFGEKTEWNPEWGEEKDFGGIAEKKMDVSKRLREDTSKIVAEHPWLFERNEYLYPGGVSRSGISVAISGAKGRTDEGLANLVADTIIMLAHLETDRRKEVKEMKI